MTGIPRAITEDRLDTYPYIEPKVQKKRSLALDRKKVATDEVNEWLKAGIIRRVRYPLWVSNPVLVKKIWVNLEAYVDDMVIKSRTEQDIIKDVEQTFSTLRKINMKLNPKKCSFGMKEGKFLGYIVTSKGIRANPGKIKAVMDMPSPKSLKQMQSLSGKLVALNRFLSKSAKRSLPFLDTLKNVLNKKDFRGQSYRSRLAKWKVELGVYGIQYVLRVTVKGQVMADFLIDTSTKVNATLVVANTPRVEDILESLNAREDLTTKGKKNKDFEDFGKNTG
ncbi:reverse transcriptase domain-containing protein [Tanacetum coccineum]